MTRHDWLPTCSLPSVVVAPKLAGVPARKYTALVRRTGVLEWVQSTFYLACITTGLSKMELGASSVATKGVRVPRGARAERLQSEAPNCLSTIISTSSSAAGGLGVECSARFMESQNHDNSTSDGRIFVPGERPTSNALYPPPVDFHQTTHRPEHCRPVSQRAQTPVKQERCRTL
jgi:hypothetical protein